MTDIKGYHAHVYYNAATKPKAAKLRETIIGKFKVEPGGFSDERLIPAGSPLGDGDALGAAIDGALVPADPCAGAQAEARTPATRAATRRVERGSMAQRSQGREACASDFRDS